MINIFGDKHEKKLRLLKIILENKAYWRYKSIMESYKRRLHGRKLNKELTILNKKATMTKHTYKALNTNTWALKRATGLTCREEI